MRKAKWVYYLSIVTGMFLLLACITACEKTEYDLLDPASAGVWKRYNTSNSALPGNTIYDIDVDPSGNLWATCFGNGLAKFESGNWTTYNTSNSYLLSNYTTVLEPVAGKCPDWDKGGLSVRLTSGNWQYFLMLRLNI